MNLEPTISLLSRLPPPPSGKTGWPWTEESESIPSLQPEGIPWPRISIVTPSYNQGQFIEETIRSVLLQNYPSLEYIIIDGGSTDCSLEIIKKYDKWITYWISETDSGQSEAINKGFDKCTGDLVNWICSDDLLCQNALNQFILSTTIKPNSLYLGGWTLINSSSVITNKGENVVLSLEMLVDISSFWRKGASITQQSALFPLQTFKKIKGLNLNNHYTMDFELWGRLLLAGCEMQKVPVMIGSFRVYPLQKTANTYLVTLSLVISSIKLIFKSDLRFIRKSIISIKNINYFFWFTYHQIRSIIGFKRRMHKVFGKN